MDSPRGRPTPPPEAGFALIEVLISGVILCVSMIGIATVMQTTVHTATGQRDRSQAYALGQEDQARLRAVRIPVLRALTEEEKKRHVTIDGLEYTIASSAAFVNNSSEGSPSCGAGENSADYLTIASEVTWTNMSPIQPIALHSIVAPPSGTLAPNSGMLAINITNGGATGVSGVGLSGTGAGTFSGTTDSTGCAIFLEQNAGEYTMTFSGAATNLVDQDGVKPTTKEITVNPETTTSLAYTLASPGSVPIAFKTTNYESKLEEAEAESLVVYNSGMPSGAKRYTFTPRTSYEATSIFPFSNPVTFYTGCAEYNKPTSGTGILNVTVPAGTKLATQTITMPALLLNAQKETKASNSIRVTITDVNCSAAPKKEYTSLSKVSGTEGRILKPELPWGTYKVCASTEAGTGSNKKQRHVEATYEVHELKTEKTLSVEAGSTAGACP